MIRIHSVPWEVSAKCPIVQHKSDLYRKHDFPSILSLRGSKKLLSDEFQQ